MIWICPVCRASLQVDPESDGKVLACTNSHRFDRAKQGYFNLLLANQKNSKTPGDDRQMLEQRRQFLELGAYQPLAEMLLDQQQAYLEKAISDDAFQSYCLLDTGCGEGYYLNLLAEDIETDALDVSFYGIDISKEAAKLTARQYPDLNIAVSSSFQLPIADHSVDIVLRVFAPGDSKEDFRVLKSGGQFWRVVPGPHHLIELKQELYDDAKLHELPSVPEGFTLIENDYITYGMEFETREAVQSLLQMTPFFWRGKREQRDVLMQRESLSMTADFVLQRFTITEVG